MLDVETLQQWASLSILGGTAFAVVVWLLFWAYDTWKIWEFIDWKEKLKEAGIMFIVLPFITIILICVVVVGWPVLAFLIIREELKERGAINEAKSLF